MILSYLCTTLPRDNTQLDPAYNWNIALTSRMRRLIWNGLLHFHKNIFSEHNCYHRGIEMSICNEWSKKSFIVKNEKKIEFITYFISINKTDEYCQIKNNFVTTRGLSFWNDIIISLLWEKISFTWHTGNYLWLWRKLFLIMQKLYIVIARKESLLREIISFEIIIFFYIYLHCISKQKIYIIFNKNAINMLLKAAQNILMKLTQNEKDN